MKKYIVKHTLFGKFENSAEAIQKFKKHIKNFDDGDVYISPFDIEEIECDVNEVITDFETARKYLGIKPNYEFTVVREKHSNIEFDDVASLVDDINPKHIEALMALNKLLTIADAWNKEDGFVPDYSDTEQEKNLRKKAFAPILKANQLCSQRYWRTLHVRIRASKCY